MSMIKPLSFSDAKKFLFFRFFSTLLWPVDVFAFLFLPVGVFFCCFVAHLYVTARYYRFLFSLICAEEAAAKT